jgi:hypothetical protein
MAAQYRKATHEEKKDILAAYTASTLGDSYLPILLNRADGRQKIVGHFLSGADLHATNGLRKDISQFYDPSTHPFKVHVFCKDIQVNPSLQAGVVYYSHLYKTIDPRSKIVINGLLSLPSDINPDMQHLNIGQGTELKNTLNSGNPPTAAPIEFRSLDTNASTTPPTGGGGGLQRGILSTHVNTLGWIDITRAEDYVWLELTITSGEVSAAKIHTNGMAGGNSTYDPTATPGTARSIVEFSGGTQTKSRVILAKITEGVVEQYVTTALFLTTVNIDGKSAIYACPSIGGSVGEKAALPFDISLKGVGTPDPNTGEFSSYTATIGAGTVNGILPSNMFEEFVVSNGVTYYFKVVATTDGKQVTAASIVVDGSLPTAQVPVPQALPAGFQMLFGIYMGGKLYRTAGIGNLSAPSQALFTADRVNQVIGRPITETWYNWRV